MVAVRTSMTLMSAMAVFGALAIAVTAWWASRAVKRMRAPPRVPQPPDTLYRWLAEVRSKAQRELDLPYLDFERSIGGESLRFVFAWKHGKLQLRISGPRLRYRFAASELPEQRWFDLGPPVEEPVDVQHDDDRFWEFDEADNSWHPVSTPEHRAEGLMLAKVFFATWHERQSRPPSGRLSVS